MNYLPCSKYALKMARNVAIVALTIAVFPVVALAQSPSPLNPASPAARSIASLHNVILWIATIVFLIVCALLAYSLVKFRRRSEDDPEPDQSFHGNATLETIWTLIPVGILVVLLILTFQTIRDIDPNRPTDLTVQVVGKQWLWEIKYPEYGISKLGQMHLPVDTDVRIEVMSEDVIHSYWVPQLGGKTDAVPGYMQVTWVKADTLGTYYGQCAEFCGTGHSKMPIKINVVDQSSFEAWIESETEEETRTIDTQKDVELASSTGD